MDQTVVHCKGMNIRDAKGNLRFSDDDLEAWWNGKPPTQGQTQRKNFLKVISGADMYHGRKKMAQKIKEKNVASKK
jgi:hypothetical protein